MMNEYPLLDKKVGMEFYVTNIFPDKYFRENIKIKLKENDFYIKEEINMELLKKVYRESYLKADWIILKLVLPYGISTMDLIRYFYLNHIHQKNFLFIGLKDKYALSIQYLLINRKYEKKILKLLERKDIKIETIGYIDRSLVTKNMLEKNLFIVKVYNPPPIDFVKELLCKYNPNFFPNYFGYQRFGKNFLNHIIGEYMLLEGDINSHIERYEEKAIFDILSSYGVDRTITLENILRKIPKYMIKFYINSFQSYIFNRLISKRIGYNYPLDKCIKGDYYLDYFNDLNKFIIKVATLHINPLNKPWAPLIGYGYIPKITRLSDRLYMEILPKLGVILEKFKKLYKMGLLIRSNFRPITLNVNSLSLVTYNNFNDEWITLNFKLGRGMYATILLREIFKPLRPNTQGFA